MTGIREVESHQPQTRAGRMNVRVDETGREKGTLQIHHLMSDFCVNAGPASSPTQVITSSIITAVANGSEDE